MMPIVVVGVDKKHCQNLTMSVPVSDCQREIHVWDPFDGLYTITTTTRIMIFRRRPPAPASPTAAAAAAHHHCSIIRR